MDLDAVYMWIRQISVFAVICFLILYLFDGKNRKIIRFYLSVILLVLIFRPVLKAGSLDQLLNDRLSEVSEAFSSSIHLNETDNSRIQEGEVRNNQEKIAEQLEQVQEEAENYTGEQILQYAEEKLEEAGFSFADGKVIFDTVSFQETAEIAVKRVCLTVKQTREELSAHKNELDSLKNQLASILEIEPNDIEIEAD